MKRKLTTGAVIAGMALTTVLAGGASAEPASQACAGLNNAHGKMIAAQGLERHLGLNVHQVFSTQLLTGC